MIMHSQFIVSCLLLTIAAQPISGLSRVVPRADSDTSTAAATSAQVTTSAASTGSVTTSSSAFDPSAPPDVVLHVPELSVGRIELDVDNLQADINLAANVAKLVTVNAGIQLSIEKVNITITDVDAQLDLTVRLGHLVDIVQRVFSSLDLNPLLINTLNNVTALIDTVIGAVDGLLGSITQNGNVLNFLVDNLGYIVQEVTTAAGAVTTTIVGDYLTNMTDTGVVKQLGDGLVQKTYSYAPLNALVDIVLNAAGQVVSAVVQKATTTSSTTAVTASATVVLPVDSSTAAATSTEAATTTAAATSTAAPVRRK